MCLGVLSAGSKSVSSRNYLVRGRTTPWTNVSSVPTPRTTGISSVLPVAAATEVRPDGRSTVVLVLSGWLVKPTAVLIPMPGFSTDPLAVFGGVGGSGEARAVSLLPAH